MKFLLTLAVLLGSCSTSVSRQQWNQCCKLCPKKRDMLYAELNFLSNDVTCVCKDGFAITIRSEAE